MKYATKEQAKKILTTRAEEFYGKTFDWLIDQMDKGFDENYTITTCYNIYKNNDQQN
tara:strand:+ start:592 stop:762 length:171 start_codon:yes stop_codon:yes gene_type:complete